MSEVGHRHNTAHLGVSTQDKRFKRTKHGKEVVMTECRRLDAGENRTRHCFKSSLSELWIVGGNSGGFCVFTQMLNDKFRKGRMQARAETILGHQHIER